MYYPYDYQLTSLIIDKDRAQRIANGDEVMLFAVTEWDGMNFINRAVTLDVKRPGTTITSKELGMPNIKAK